MNEDMQGYKIARKI